ncbi:MAG TPA: hypothetical protein VE084_09705, partial [Burkholderiaceae bacterium]|nr:hypothetical protein [Burkholderiaceae bacterium]
MAGEDSPRFIEIKRQNLQAIRLKAIVNEFDESQAHLHIAAAAAAANVQSSPPIDKTTRPALSQHPRPPPSPPKKRSPPMSIQATPVPGATLLKPQDHTLVMIDFQSQ